MADDFTNTSGISSLLNYKTRIGLVIHLGVLGWITILTQTGIIVINSVWHDGLIVFVGGQMIVFAGAMLVGIFRSGNPKVRCQACNAAMNPISYKCPICNASFNFGN